MVLASEALEVKTRALDNNQLSIVRGCFGRGGGVCDARRGRGRFGMAKGEHLLCAGDGEVDAIIAEHG